MKKNQEKNNVNNIQETQRVSWFFNLPRKIVFTGIYVLASLIILISFVFITWNNNRVIIPETTFGADTVTPQRATQREIRNRHGFDVELRANHIRLVGIAPNINSGNAQFQARVVNNTNSNIHNNQIQYRVVLGANWIGFQTAPSNIGTMSLNQTWGGNASLSNINQRFPASRFGIIRIQEPTAFLIISWESGVVAGQRTRHTYVISFDWNQFVNSSTQLT